VLDESEVINQYQIKSEPTLSSVRSQRTTKLPFGVLDRGSETKNDPTPKSIDEGPIKLELENLVYLNDRSKCSTPPTPTQSFQDSFSKSETFMDRISKYQFSPKTPLSLLEGV
jgi:hypothetical protein